MQIVNKTLKDICKNYNINIKNRAQTPNKEIKPLPNYEFMLCKTKLEIAQYTIKKDPQRTQSEIQATENILDKYKNSPKFIELENKLEKLKQIFTNN